ncbi:G patch domain-containing protein 8-like isoform X2 [Watersipora subatra]
MHNLANTENTKLKKKKTRESKQATTESHVADIAVPTAASSSTHLSTAATTKAVDINAKDVLPSFSSIANGENVKVEKKVKKLKHLKKKILNEHPGNSAAVKKPKIIQPECVVDETSQQRIKIAFNQNSGKLSTKSKWDTSSDEEGSSRKGAISYRFSDESDTQPSIEPKKKIQDALSQKPPAKSKQMPFGRMQPGGILQSIEIHNPLPDMKPAVPIAHPNPGPDGAGVKSPSKSKSRSRSRTRSRSRSYSYSTDGSYHRSHRRKRHSKRRKRSYSRSYSRSRSRSYSSSRSRSYSRSYSRSTSRSHSRYRSYSRSSYSSYSSRSYSSRSRSRSPRYTRAVQPKYNNTRAYNLGKRKKFNKKKNQYKNQQNQIHQNPNIQKQLETGRMKAEETVMRLKKQKEQQEDLQKRALESIAKAASSAGIPLPSSTATSTPPVSAASSNTSAATTGAISLDEIPKPVNGGGNGLIESYAEASQLSTVPALLPRTFQNREFIGPVRPGMESDIPLPDGAPSSNPTKDAMALHEPLPMPVPNTEDDVYKDLEAQAIQHVRGSNSSPSTEQMQQMGVVQYLPQLQETTTQFIDPLTGLPVQLAQFPGVHPQQFLAQQLQLQQQAPTSHAQSPLSSEGETQQQLTEDGNPAPHEAVVQSYAHQVFMSQQKALVSQSQSTFTMASSNSTVPQAGLPIQTSTPVMVTASQLQLAQFQQAQIQQAQAAQAAQAAHALQLQQLQQLQAASLGLPHQTFAFHPSLQHMFAPQQLMQAQAIPQQPLLLANGQVVLPNAAAHAMVLQRLSRPM